MILGYFCPFKYRALDARSAFASAMIKSSKVCCLKISCSSLKWVKRSNFIYTLFIRILFNMHIMGCFHLRIPLSKTKNLNKR